MVLSSEPVADDNANGSVEPEPSPAQIILYSDQTALYLNQAKVRSMVRKNIIKAP